VSAAEEAEELAEKAEEAAEAAAAKPKAKRAAKAREAEQAADQAEEAAEEATASAKRSTRAKAKDTEAAKPAKKKAAAKKKATDDEDEAAAKKPAAKKKAAAKKDAEPAKEAKKPARRRRDSERAVPVGLTVRAQAKYVRTSARKARLVCDHIRGKDVVEARAILAFTPRSAAKPWLKLLESAVANAEHNHELVGEELRIESVHADEGPTLKRFRPRAMGRATRIRKRTSHLTITLTPKES
jgi:ribosomal protein L22